MEGAFHYGQPLAVYSRGVVIKALNSFLLSKKNAKLQICIFFRMESAVFMKLLQICRLSYLYPWNRANNRRKICIYAGFLS